MWKEGKKMNKTLNVGLIGAGFMAKAHSIAYATMSMHFWPTPAKVIRKTICDLSEEGAKQERNVMGLNPIPQIGWISSMIRT